LVVVGGERGEREGGGRGEEEVSAVAWRGES